ncbi:hypothetical protein STEG23_001178 [Scotinomys teguina]
MGDLASLHSGEMAPPLTMDMEELALPPHLKGPSQWSGPTNSATTQTYTLSLEIAHPNIYPIYDLLECVKGLFLWNNNHRISMTQGNSRISERSLCEGDDECARGLEPDQ